MSGGDLKREISHIIIYKNRALNDILNRQIFRIVFNFSRVKTAVTPHDVKQIQV